MPFTSSPTTPPTETPEARLEYIHDEAQLQDPPEECPDLRELNNSLEALAALFPNVQPEVFREMLSNFDSESRLAVVADALLKNHVNWVKGRWRITEDKDAFRSDEYKKAVQALAWTEFKGLTRSAVNAVLAEFNYSYLDARKTLLDLSAKSWRFTISSLFSRRKPATAGDAENHPLLDRELYGELIRPLKDRARATQLDKDRGLALVLNSEEAEACNADGHMICFRCVQLSLTEAVFGQGWHSSIDTHAGTLRCLAVDGAGCGGQIPAHHLHRAMLEEKKGAEILHKLDQRLADHSLLASGLPLIRCPFCDYAEVDDIYLPQHEDSLRPKADGVLSAIFLLLCVGSIPFLMPLVLLSSLLCLAMTTSRASLATHWSRALHRRRRRRRGPKFTCRAPRCGRTSCLACAKPWADLTCPCGYKMCYVCRKDIGGPDGAGEGYRHFCEHFRPNGDPRPCDECDRCNLWESEDTDEVLRRARDEAERRWKETEARDLSGAERVFLDTGFAAAAAGRDDVSVEQVLRAGRLPSVAQICDLVVENLFV
ncbi:E3 ubiquitin-protein ligase like [Verticillium longisporum]|uniref:E3 ubiquitin-protein ligase like n=1 Tax=Verticillium longisporum TaxID=100787 RepID=A0A8I2ZJ44_VERLO|nr:E3 ubiquitin-protein ligase like [Verticillium longisporum]